MEHTEIEKDEPPRGRRGFLSDSKKVELAVASNGERRSKAVSEALKVPLVTLAMSI